MPKKIYLMMLFLFFLGLVLLVKKPATPTVSQPAYKKLTVAVGTSSTVHIINYLIKTKGYDKEFGLQLDYKTIDFNNAGLALLNNIADIVALPPLEVVRLNIKGHKTTMFYPAIKMACPFITLKDSSVKNTGDIKGKKLGILARTSSAYTILAILLKSKDEDIEKTYNIITSTQASLIPLLQKKDIDAVTGVCNALYVGKAMAGGKIKTVGSLEEAVKGEYGVDREIIFAGYSAKTDWLVSHKDEVKSYIKAVEKATIYLKENPDIYSTDEKFMKEFRLDKRAGSSVSSYVTLNNVYNLKSWDKIIPDLTFFVDKAVELGYLQSAPKEKIFVKIE